MARAVVRQSNVSPTETLYLVSPHGALIAHPRGDELLAWARGVGRLLVGDVSGRPSRTVGRVTLRFSPAPPVKTLDEEVDTGLGREGPCPGRWHMGTAATLPRGVMIARKVREQPRRLIPLGVVVVALLAWAGYQRWAARQPYTWAGTVEARDIAVGSRVGGRVKDVLVREGERVEPGQPLVVLEAGDLPAQRLQAEGQLLQAQATLDKLRGQGSTRGTGSLAEQVARARAELTAAQVALDKAQLDARRARTLFQQEVNTRAELDTAEAALRQARAERDVRRSRLQELEQGSDADVRAQQGQVEAARGRLEAIDVALGELTIRAPVAARVESLDLRPGDLLPVNATAATLVEDDQLYVRIYVPETHLGRLRPGSELPVRVDSFPERTFTGVVETIASQGEYTPRNLQTPDERASQVFATRIGLRDDGRRLLRAGMAAYVTVPK